MFDQLTSPEAKKFIDKVAQPFENVPHLPKGIIDFLVKIAPWLAGIGGVLTLLSALSSFGAAAGTGSIGMMVPYMVRFNPVYFIVVGVIEVAVGILLLKAFTPLKTQQYEGWIYMFWTNMLNIVQMVVGILLVGSNLVGAVIGILIGLYFLFELKPSYEGKVKKVVDKIKAE